MIEIIEAKNRMRVIRKDGRLTASAVDPRAEAVAWVGRRAEFLNEVRAIIVLGAGSGHHLAALTESSTARLIVIELDPEIARATDGHTIVTPPTLADLRADPEIRAAVKDAYMVLDHRPSWIGNEARYAEYQAFLLGRDWRSLAWLRRVRGYPEGSRLATLDAGRDLTLVDVVEPGPPPESWPEGALLKALRELLK